MIVYFFKIGLFVIILDMKLLTGLTMFNNQKDERCFNIFGYKL
jgi:hypothetical protein